MSIAFINAWGILFKGGPMMWPILLLSIVALVIAIEKFIQLNKAQQELIRFKEAVFMEIRQQHLKEALILCEESAGFIGRILKGGVVRFGQPRLAVLMAMEDAAAIEIHQLKQRLGILALITNVAPILGILGTVSAMTVVFHAVQMRANALNPLSLGDMSSGIWQALLATTAGLLVGVISLTAYSFCRSRVNDLIVSIDQMVKEAANLLES